MRSKMWQSKVGVVCTSILEHRHRLLPPFALSDGLDFAHEIARHGHTLSPSSCSLSFSLLFLSLSLLLGEGHVELLCEVEGQDVMQLLLHSNGGALE